MKNTIQYIAVSFVISLVFSCGNDFLTDEPTFISEGSPIVISPDWEAQDYAIYCEGVGSAEFTVAHAPSWMTISSRSGQFTNHVATLNCKANVHKDFSEIGIYHAILTLSVESKGNVAIPVTYIIEGNPVIEIANSVTISYDNPNSSSLLIKNAGNGILMWSVIQRPEWLLMYGEMYESSVIEDYSVYVSPSNGQSFIYLSLDPTVSFSENLSGKIVILTNDKNKPIVEVEIQIGQGNGHGDPVIETANLLSMSYSPSYHFTYGRLSVKNIGSGILQWNISELPEWLSDEQIFAPSPNDPYNLSQNEEGVVYISDKPNFSFNGYFSNKIVISSNDINKPKVEVEIQMDFGNPVLQLVWEPGKTLEELGIIDFGRTETTQDFSFSNQGYGLLAWEIESYPEWLTISNTCGTLRQYYSTTLTFACNREMVPPGMNEVIIYLKTTDTNTPSYPITVIVGNIIANPDNVKPIDGNITDAYFDKQTNVLYLTTVQPNRFMAYDTENRTILHELSLNRAPTCFSLSEDGQKAVIGHSGYITSVDVMNFSVVKTIEVNYNIFDIEWGVDNWVCYTPGQEVQHYYLQWKNIETEATYDTPYDGGGNLYGGTIIKRIPHQNYIVASRLQLSPTGITVFDGLSRNYVSYFHETIDKFWFSSDGYHLFSSIYQIFRTSSFFSSSSDISSIGRFSPDPFLIYWIDHNEASQSVWILSSSMNYYFDEQRVIMQYEDNDYTRKAIYYYDEIHNGRPVQAHYVFANQAGTELVVIRNATNGTTMWSLEFIPVSK